MDISKIPGVINTDLNENMAGVPGQEHEMDSDDSQESGGEDHNGGHEIESQILPSSEKD